MKLSEKLLKALVAQVNMESASGYLYRSMSHDMKNLALNGYAKWLDKQYEEERTHALKLIGYIEDRDGVVDFTDIAGVKKHYSNPLDVAKDSLAHEEAVSASIRSIFKLAREEGDLETEVFLQWYLTEQVEEEVNARDNVAGFEKQKTAMDCSTCSTLILLIVNRIMEKRHLIGAVLLFFKKDKSHPIVLFAVSFFFTEFWRIV